MILEIVPNWRQFWTKVEVEKELPNFAFNGVGWYFDGSGGAMLVSESSRTFSDSSLPLMSDNETRYWFHYWDVSPLESFKWVANAPVIEDLRK
jgi:hypothetical protein